LEAVLAKALAVSPQDRFQNAGEFLEAAIAAAGTSANAVFDPVITARPGAVPSSTMQLAPTVLLPSESPPTAPPTLRPPRPAEEESKQKAKGSGLGTTVIVLVVLVGGAIAFSTTKYKGAKETRTFITSVVEASKKEASRLFPNQGGSPSPGTAPAAPKLPVVPSTAPATPKCPPGTQPVTADLRDGRCIDELPISETEYAACPTCDAPQAPPTSKNKRGSRGFSEFCMTGQGPTQTAITCIGKAPAEAYCKTRGARLPKDDEIQNLRANSASKDNFEWVQGAKTGRGQVAPFRCVHGR
jgi:hypothetical protein